MRQVFVGTEGFETFADYVGLTEPDREIRRRTLSSSYMPFRVSGYYADLIRTAAEPDRAALLNVVSAPGGAAPFVGRFDPYGNVRYAQDEAAFLQHKYPRTLLVHLTDACTAHCQFCYKVNEIKHEKSSAAPVEGKIDAALRYLDQHPEVDNILLTGGDPGALKPAVLRNAIERLVRHSHVRILRFATKSIVFDPIAFADPALIALLADLHREAGKQVLVIAQINHPAEITPEVGGALRLLRGADVQVRGQPAVVRGVNADRHTLARLLRVFADHRIVPYYFTIFMPVRGVEQYGIKIDEALREFQAAQADLNGVEKRGILLISHDYGKLEVLGVHGASGARQIWLRWQEVVAAEYLPATFRAAVPHAMGSVLALRYPTNGAYSVDELLSYNNMPAGAETAVPRERGTR